MEHLTSVCGVDILLGVVSAFEWFVWLLAVGDAPCGAPSAHLRREIEIVVKRNERSLLESGAREKGREIGQKRKKTEEYGNNKSMHVFMIRPTGHGGKLHRSSGGGGGIGCHMMPFCLLSCVLSA